MRFSSDMADGQKLLILTRLKDAAHHVDAYFAGIRRLSYPRKLISIALLESDSEDDTPKVFRERLAGPCSWCAPAFIAMVWCFPVSHTESAIQRFVATIVGSVRSRPRAWESWRTTWALRVGYAAARNQASSFLIGLPHKSNHDD